MQSFALRMVSFSKFAILAARGSRPAFINSFKGGLLISQVRHAGPRTFIPRISQLLSATMFDTLQFYALLSFGLICGPLIYLHIVYGPLELRDLPEGADVHHWEYERLLPSRLLQIVFYANPQEIFEKHLHTLKNMDQRLRYRRVEQRVRQLVYERADYKAWYYQSVPTKWIEWEHFQQQRLQKHFNAFDHNP